MKGTQDLTQGPVGRQIIRFALPMLIGNLFQQLYNVVDSIIVGNVLGKEALAAVGSGFPILFSVISFFIGTASGFTIVTAQYYGAKKLDALPRLADTMYIFLLVSSIVVSAIGLLFTDAIFRLMDIPEEIIPQATEYLRIIFGGIILFFGFNGTSAILRGLGDSKTPLYFLIVSTLFNILFDYLFVMVLDMGVAGAAWATLISQGGAFITGIIYLNRTHPIIQLRWRKYIFDKALFYKSVRIGLPGGFQQTFVAIGFLALFRIVNSFGTNVVAAYTVAIRINQLVSLPAMNFGSALSTFTGQNLGAGKSQRVKQGLRTTLFISSLFAVAVSLFVIIYRHTLIGIFVQDEAVIRLGAEYLSIASIFYVIFSAMFVYMGVMRGAGDTIFTMLVSLLSLWVIRIPLAYILSSWIGVTGIWWSIPVGWTMGMLASLIYYNTGRWKRHVVIKKSTPNSTQTIENQ